jgi:putative transposase
VADESIPSICLTFKYRLLPRQKQHRALEAICESQRQLYNAALEERVGCYRVTGKGRTYYDQSKALTELRQDPEFSNIPVNIQRWTLRRLDEAYQAFFRRVKVRGERAGFPRFRGKGRWDSFGFREFDGALLRGKRLYFKGMPGGLLVHLHRPLPEGRVCSCVFRRDVKGWTVCFQVRVPRKEIPATGKQVGIDVGLTHLATLSTGETIPNPRTARRAERELRRRQRALSRCQKGSNRRRKVRKQVTRLHAKVANARTTYLHQISSRLVKDYDLIGVEKLNVAGLASSVLAKSVHDASWGRLGEMLAYKAAWAGRQLVKVDARNTSQACSGCGVLVRKELSERRHCCPACGLELDRDHNAALNVLRRAVVRPESLNVRQ